MNLRAFQTNPEMEPLMQGLAVVVLIFFMCVTGTMLMRAAIKERTESGWLRAVYFVFSIAFFIFAIAMLGSPFSGTK